MMKKVIIGIFLIVIIIIASFVTWYSNNLKEIEEIKKFNGEFEEYLNKEVTGVDLTTIINKALENNNKYKVKKDSKGVYVDDEKNSIEIIIKPLKEGNSFPMEAFEKVGMKEFTKNFGSAIFKASKIEYHKNEEF